MDSTPTPIQQQVKLTDAIDSCLDELWDAMLHQETITQDLIVELRRAIEAMVLMISR